jgi:hypothetical protein
MVHKITIFILVLAGLVEILTLRLWLSCKNLTDMFHHSSINLALQIQSLAAEERGTPLLLTRAFNNKLTDGILDLLRFYLHFWDVRFGINWFSLIGYFGIFFGIYYIISSKKRKLYHWIALLVLLLLPFIEILIEPSIPIIFKAIYLWLPYSLFSLYGIYQFLTHGSKKKRIIVLLTLIVLSFWSLIFIAHYLPTYCTLPKIILHK